MALLEGKPRAATVRARESSILLEINGEAFRQVLTRYHEVESKILIRLIERLRSTNEQILRVKLQGIDEKIDQLSARIGDEIRIVDSRLQAAQALFDQTKLRTDEVINSAERSRTRLTATVSTAAAVVGIAVTLFGWLGFREILNVREKAATITREEASILKLANETRRELGDLNTFVAQFKSIRIKFYQQIMIPSFEDAMKVDLEKAEKYYKAILETEDPGITDALFSTILSYVIFRGGNERQDYQDMLERGIAKYYTQTPRQIILSYYLILSSLILENDQETEKFKAFMSDYEEYLRDYRIYHKGVSIKSSLQDVLVFDEIRERVPDASDQSVLFRRIERLIP